MHMELRLFLNRMQLTGIFNCPVGEEEFMISGDNATINFNMDMGC
jgi:hypothetical protein